MNPHYHAVSAAKDLLNTIDFNDVELDLNNTTITDGDGATTITLTTPKKGVVKITRFSDTDIVVNDRCVKLTKRASNAIVDRLIRGPEINLVMLTKTLLDVYVGLRDDPRPKIRIKDIRIGKGTFDHVVIKDTNTSTAYVY